MLYPIDFETRLGFDQIRQRISRNCLSPAGAKRVADMQFSADVTIINLHLQQTLEFKQIFERGEEFPSSHFADTDDYFKKAAIEGSYLDETEFLQIAYSLQTILACKDFLTKNKEKCPALFDLTLPVTITKKAPDMIVSVIDDNASVKDTASAELQRIRRKLRDEQAHVRRLTDQLYRNAIAQAWVPEGALPTIREGRLVIPILAEHKRKMKGFILDESATGQTVFMEPAEVLELNNEIRDLEHAQKREVLRILKGLTDSLRDQLPSLVLAYTFLSQIDFIRAKAKFSLELDAVLPVIDSQPGIQWRMAIHPLLFLSLKGKRPVIPLDIELNSSSHMLLVSGPNAGGKSVCLKTVGLLQYMLQCGLLIPVSPDSRAGIFQDIFIDIGDQQSIENDLSTYSSHLKNLGFFLQHASSRSLVLLDELGAGTDPNFGGPIAQAILQGLVMKHVWGVATTHYYNLKLFAGQTHGIRNAAMRFDERNLTPLYILDIGKPGSSFALEIAQKTGLPSYTLEEAQRLIGKELMGVEVLIQNLEREKTELTEKVKAFEKQEAQLKSLVARYDKLSADLENRKKEIIEKAKLEANALLRDTNKQIEKTIRHIRENQAERKETSKVRKNLQELSKKVTAPPAQLREQQGIVIQAGDRVRIIGQEGSGIVESIQGKNAIVQLGELKSMIALTKLEKTSAAQIKQEVSKKLQSIGIKLHEKQSHFNPTLDIRGKRVDEVVPLLDQFIDTAILLSQGEVRILHGKGEGVLRKVVRDQLKRYKQVASVLDEHVERGGDGISIVVLK